MLIAFELLQEAGLRLPDPIGDTVSIIGALIVGQSAVEAKVISPIAVIVVATAGIAGYAQPSQDLGAALRICRFALVIAAIAARAVRRCYIAVPFRVVSVHDRLLRPQLHRAVVGRTQKKSQPDVSAAAASRGENARAGAEHARQKEADMRKLIAILCALGVAVLSAGCSGGSIYSNYRDIAELMIVQTLGFDSMPDGGVTVSVSAEGSSGAGSEDGSKKPERLSASAASLTEAQDELQHYSGGLQLFFGHTAYFLLGADVLNTDTARFFDCIERDTAFRLSIPVFAVSSGSASELILGAGDEERDATKLMHALTQELRLRGNMHVYTAAEIISAMDVNGAALICAVAAAPAGATDPDAGEDEMAVVPDGYTIIYKNKACGRIPAELARGVSLILNEAGPMTVSVGNAALQIDKAACDIEPVFGDGLEGLTFNIKISASLAEVKGGFDPDELASGLEDAVRVLAEGVLELEKSTGCDFLHLGSALEMLHPVRLRGAAENLALVLPDLDMRVCVSARLDRSFNLDLKETGQ